MVVWLSCQNDISIRTCQLWLTSEAQQCIFPERPATDWIMQRRRTFLWRILVTLCDIWIGSSQRHKSNTSWKERSARPQKVEEGRGRAPLVCMARHSKMISAGGNLFSELAMALRRTMYWSLKHVLASGGCPYMSSHLSFVVCYI